MAETVELWTLVHEQRDRIGDLLAGLSEDEWHTESLAAGWSIHDMTAHLIETQLMTPPVFVGRFIGSGFQFHKMSAKNVARHSAESDAELLAQYRATAHRTSAPPGPKVTWLGEAVIHGEDIARPTGKHIDVNPESLTLVLDYAVKTTPLLHGKERSAGLKLRATDVEWSTGEGPEVSGPAASLIMGITGRRAGLADLSGEGLETLRSRT